MRRQVTNMASIKKHSIPQDPCMVYIYLHEWLIFMVNVGKYTIHGYYGNCDVCNTD